jgi:hypothetical protein
MHQSRRVLAAVGVLAVVGSLVVLGVRPSSPPRQTAASAGSGRQPAATVSPSAAASLSAKPSPSAARLARPSATPAVTVAQAPAAAPVANTGLAPSARPAAAAITHFAALAGPDCPSASSYGTSIGGGWLGISSGGWTGNGCGGAYTTHWVTSSTVTCCSIAYSTFTWWFHTGLTTGTCSVSVYIPEGSTQEVGGKPAPYLVYRGSGQADGSFNLDQRDNMSQWLSAGSFPESGGSFEVQLDNSARGSHRVAASALKVSCTA